MKQLKEHNVFNNTSKGASSLVHFSPFGNLNKADSVYSGLAFVIFHREQLPHKSSESDFIETNKTLGGLTMIKSMLNNTVLFTKLVLAILSSNKRPEQINNIDRKTLNFRTVYLPI